MSGQIIVQIKITYDQLTQQYNMSILYPSSLSAIVIVDITNYKRILLHIVFSHNRLV